VGERPRLNLQRAVYHQSGNVHRRKPMRRCERPKSALLALSCFWRDGAALSHWPLVRGPNEVDPCPKMTVAPGTAAFARSDYVAPIQVGHVTGHADHLSRCYTGDGAGLCLLECDDRRAVERPLSGMWHPQRISLTKNFRPPFPCTTNISTAAHRLFQRIGPGGPEPIPQHRNSDHTNTARAV